jgi:ABC-2 type transport system ATP-binding protein
LSGRDGAAAIRLVGVRKTFAPPPAPWRRWLGRPPLRAVEALRDVHLELAPGEVLGLLGPNGAGKTVLLKVVATLTPPSAGVVRVLGLDAATDARAIRAGIGFASSDERCFYGRLTARQNLDFFGRLYGLRAAERNRRIEHLLATVGLAAATGRSYRTLSAGNRQRLSIARALLHDPPLLLLDEPTSRLDPQGAAALRELIRERIADRRRAVVLATHDLVEAEALCDRIAVLVAGSIRSSGPAAALRAAGGRSRRVDITARAPADGGAVDRLRAGRPGLSVREGAARTLEISFACDGDDGALHGVLADLVRGGFAILSCRSAEPTLRTAFDELVGGEAPPAEEAAP